MVLGQARITDEGVAQLKTRVGSYFKGEYIFAYSKTMTKGGIAHWCDGIGDFNNPLYRDETYAKKTKYGCIMAPPCSLNSILNVSGMRVGGLPGVHSFHSGWDWLWLKPVLVNEPITCTYRPVDIVEKKSEFALRTVIIYAEGVYRNQRDEIVAKCIGWSIRAERGTARDQGKYKEIKQYFIDEEMQKRVEYILDHEEIRGANPRYWEDVNVGDEIPQIVKGPLSVGEMMAWAHSIGGGGEVHTFRMRALRKHPAWGWKNPETGVNETIDQVHEQEEAAKGIAIPAAYDVGAQRNSWVSQCVTNWMGDDGFLKSLYCEYRRFNVYGDIQFIKGKITKKYEQNGQHLVNMDIWAENQRGEVTAPGKATVVLPVKTPQYHR
jgi:acyl dehydratase